MKRISSLPVLEYCGMSDKLQKNVESTQAFRSTCFHSFCETGKWPAETSRLSEQDRLEISRWKVPGKIRLDMFDGLVLDYKNSVKECLLALDSSLNYIDVPQGLTQDELNSDHNIFLSGHLDFCFHIEALSLVVVIDIKSSIFAVKDRCESLQLHGYGVAYCKQVGAKRYLTGIWDASDGKYYLNDRVVELDSFEGAEIQERIRLAAANESDKFTKGSHCGSCWKRDSCPAHLVDLGSDNRFASLFSDSCSEKDVREALIAVKGLGELSNKVTERCKQWVKSHGPVRSEDERKHYVVKLRKGRASLDQDAIMRDLGVDSLEKYQKIGNDFEVYDWVLIKEK